MKPIPVAFHIGPLEVHTYGLGLAVTFWFAYRYFDRRLARQGYRTDWVVGMFIGVVVAAVVGARALHVLTNLTYYRHNPGDILAIWHGGLSSFGGLLLAVPTGIILTRRACPELPIGRALDLLAPVLMASWAIGRLLGPQLMVAGGGHPTHQWFGMYYVGQSGRRIPVPVIQALEDFSVFCILILIERRLARRAVAHAGPAGRATSPGGAALASPVGAVVSPLGGAAVSPLGGAAVPSLGGAALGAPSGVVLGTGMILWGIERTLDEHLWLGEDGHLGSLLVQIAGVGLAVGGIALLVVARGRWAGWLASGTGAPPPQGPFETIGVAEVSVTAPAPRAVTCSRDAPAEGGSAPPASARGSSG